jgi:anion-transporting  ArsA/GET3 family ATPase
MTPIYICCGAGGVGKTSASAALALALAQRGAKVVVLTIDPARRLADALGVRIGNEPSLVVLPPELGATGTLHALMLDPKETFDRVVGRFAPTPHARDRIYQNHIYQHVSANLAGAQEYMAMERLYELASDGAWDCVVLDTPPTRHALDFLAAPDRMANLMDEGVMRWLVLPASRGGWRMIERGSEVLARVLERMVGHSTIADIAEFFTAFQALWDGFRERSVEVRRLLAAPTTRFFLVTTPAPAARAEARLFVEQLRQHNQPLAGFLLNRCVPGPQEADVPDFGSDPGVPHWEETVAALKVFPARQRARVAVQEENIADLAKGTNAPVWRIPDLGEGVHDLAGIALLAVHVRAAVAV